MTLRRRRAGRFEIKDVVEGGRQDRQQLRLGFGCFSGSFRECHPARPYAGHPLLTGDGRGKFLMKQSCG
jgi:hypothetical protein